MTRDLWARGDAYEAYVGRWSRPVAALFVPWLAAPPGRRWLDVGCGTGALTGTVLATAAPAEVTGIDPSPAFLTTARSRFIFGSGAPLATGSGSTAPLIASAAEPAAAGPTVPFAAGAAGTAGGSTGPFAAGAAGTAGGSTGPFAAGAAGTAGGSTGPSPAGAAGTAGGPTVPFAAGTAAGPPVPFAAGAAHTAAGSTVRLVAGDARALPVADASVDAVVSGLALNFVPEPAAAVAEFARVVTPGGVVAAYVWDYAEGMTMMRHFWDAATSLDPAAATLDEGRRHSICDPGALSDLWSGAGLSDVTTRPIDTTAVFTDFDDYWSPFLGGTGPAPTYVASLPAEHRDELRDLLRARLPRSADGSIRLLTRAFAVRGTAT